jgi:hypothetical protein
VTWLANVIARTAAHEGGYASVAPNRDGAGLAWGILQWTQASGNLGKLLAAMAATDGAAFARIFGPAARELLAATATPGLRSVAGAQLWQEPWLSRFRAAGEHPAFRAVQDRVALEGAHLRAALDAAGSIGVLTERSIALAFDTAVQQGPGAVASVAGKVRSHVLTVGPNPHGYGDLLARFAQTAADRFRRRTPPDPSSASASRWRQVGSEWHLFAGELDLYRNVLARRSAILRDPLLGDVPVQGAVA